MRAKAFTPSGVRFKGQTEGLYTQSEWASKIGIQQAFNFFWNDVAPGAGLYLYYLIPEGMLLLVNAVEFYGYATDIANRDHNQIIGGRFEDATIPEVMAYYGGNGGGSVVFPSPIRFEGGHEIRSYLYNFSDHNMNLRLSFWAYQITAE